MIRVFVRRRRDRSNLVLFYDDPQTGKEVSRSAGTSDHNEAQKRARDWENELVAFRGTNEDGWDLFKVRFFDERYATLSKGSRTACRTALKRYAELMRPALVSDITADSLSRFTSLALKKYAVPTVSKHLRHLKVALRWAAKVGIIAAAPHVEIPKQGKRLFMRGRPITSGEYRRMVAHAGAATGEANAPHWRRLLRLLWLSGLRLKEATMLRWDAPPIYLDLEASPYPQLLIYGEGQKSGDDEALPLAPDLVAWLGKAPEDSRTGLVAPLRGRTGKRLRSPTNISKAIVRIAKAARVKVTARRYAGAHDLRRAFGTRWSLRVPPMVLQKMMRHATLQTTMRYYVRLDSSQIGAVLWKGVPPETPPSGTSNSNPRKKRRAKDS